MQNSSKDKQTNKCLQQITIVLSCLIPSPTRVYVLIEQSRYEPESPLRNTDLSHTRAFDHTQKKEEDQKTDHHHEPAPGLFTHFLNARREMCVDLRLRGIPELGGAETHNAATGWCLERFEQKEKTRGRSKHSNFFFFLLCVCDVLRSALRNGIEDGRRYRVLTKIPRE